MAENTLSKLNPVGIIMTAVGLGVIAFAIAYMWKKGQSVAAK